MKKILSVETMHCEHCAKSVKDAILSVGGIKSVKIDLKKQTAVVSYKEFKEDEVKSPEFKAFAAACKKRGITITGDTLTRYGYTIEISWDI